MELTCRPDGLYARTVNGFWKILWIEGVGLLLLHRNRFEPDKTDEEMAPGPYHRQKDVKVTDCLAKLSRFGYENVSVLAIEAGAQRKHCCWQLLS